MTKPNLNSHAFKPLDRLQTTASTTANNKQEEHLRHAPSNTAVAGVTVDLFISLVPKAFQAGARWGVYALMDPPLLKAMGFPRVKEAFTPGDDGWEGVTSSWLIDVFRRTH